MLGILRQLLQGHNLSTDPIKKNPTNPTVPYAPQQQPQQPLRVQPSQRMQPAGLGAEDDYTPTDALYNTGYFNPQITRHGYFNQGGIPRGSIQAPQNSGNYDQIAELRRILGY